MGALSFYLTYHFYVTGEFQNFTSDDWVQNSTWFDVKLLVDVFGNDFKRKISGNSCSQAVKAVLQALEIPATSLVHIGYKLGPKLLELLEEESGWIQSLGNWNPSIQQTSYSTKLPMCPIQKLTGFTKANGMYYNPRTVVEVPSQLEKKTLIGSWAIHSLQELQNVVGSETKYTALHFLKFMVSLNKVFLQDAVAMLVLHPERSKSPLFNLEVFKDEAFKVSTIVIDCRLFILFYIVFLLITFLSFYLACRSSMIR